MIGWLGWIHQRSIEHLRAAEDCELIELELHEIEALWSNSQEFKNWIAAQRPNIELIHLLLQLSHGNPARSHQLDDWKRLKSKVAAAIDHNPPRKGGGHWHQIDGQIWPNQNAERPIQQRLLWLPDPEDAAIQQSLNDLGPKRAPRPRHAQGLTLQRASGARDIPLAICKSLAEFHGVPFNRDNLLDEIDAVLNRQQTLNLINVGQLLSSLDLSVSLVELPMAQLSRVPCPAVLNHQGHTIVLEGIADNGQLRLLDPELGPLTIDPDAIQPSEGERLPVLLLRRRPDSKEQRFSWSWYGPFLRPHRRELIEVLVTSGVVNVLALVTPLGIMRLINARTGGSDSLDAVISIGVILIGASVVAAIASALRSLIFTGIANRVDMDTRETILDRLVRLPQGFFDARPVGRITYYFNQLDRLRDFLISRALTTLVDFSFSLLYLAVLFSLNPLLTLVTLSTLPLFVVLALIANPIVENQIDKVVQEGVRTNSYLTEAITGIQTIKSQNAELKTRWDFQDRYSRFIGEDFKLKVSGETVGALAKFLGDLTGIATMVVGIWLVSKNELSIGALFAFRIIGDRVTGPLVQLVQTWQQFKIQSRNLTLAADVVDRPTEQSERGAANIPMPPSRGRSPLKTSTSGTKKEAKPSSTTSPWTWRRAPLLVWWVDQDRANRPC